MGRMGKIAIYLSVVLVGLAVKDTYHNTKAGSIERQILNDDTTLITAYMHLDTHHEELIEALQDDPTRDHSYERGRIKIAEDWVDELLTERRDLWEKQRHHKRNTIFPIGFSYD